MQLRNDVEELTDAGIQVVGISYDAVDTLKQFSDAQQLPFLLLSDPGSKTIHAYGLHFKDGLPQPATLIVDQAGVIRAKLFRDGYAERHGNDELLAAAKALR